MIESCGRVRAWLERSYCIQAPEDWLQACVEWIHSENQGESLSVEALQQLVYEQWLLSDLTEVGATCLPADINQHPKLQLTHNYCLQVNSLVDAGTPFYSQLQKVEGTENENASVTATQATQWNEPKPSRMLMLRMTDGSTEIQGMEYQPIPQLAPTLSPGAKIVIHGPVLCRLGVLMLTRDHVQVLGGEVDSLTESLSRVQMLKNAMQENEPYRENPTGEKIWKGSGNYTKQGKSEKPKTQTKTNTWQSQTRTSRPSNPITRPQTTDAELSDDDFLQGIDTEQLDQLEQQFGGNDTRQESAQTRPTANRSVQSNNKPTHRYQNSAASSVATGVHSSGNNPGDNRARPADTFQSRGLVSGSSFPTSQAPNQANGSRLHKTANNSSNTMPSNQNNVPADFDDFDDFNDIDMDVMMEHMDYQDQNQKTKIPENKKPSAPLENHFSGATIRNSTININISVTDRKPASAPATNVARQKPNKSQGQARQSSIASFMSKTAPRPESNVTPFRPEVPKPIVIVPTSIANSASNYFEDSHPSRHDSAGTSSVCEPPKAKKLRPSDSPEQIYNVPIQDDDDVSITHVKEARHSCSSRLERDTKVPINVNSSWSGPPYCYIADVKNIGLTDTRRFIFKVYIVTLLGKLEYNNGSHWSLLVRINDGSATWDVDLGDEMLSGLIGFNASRCLQVKNAGHADKSLKVKLSKGLKHCQQQLVKMSVMMEIEHGGQRSRPYVRRTWAPNHGDLEQLQRRVMTNSR